MDVKKLIEFLAELKQNNKKTWMDEHRDRYKSLRTDLVEFINQVHHDMLVVDCTLVHMDPKKSLFRINRDVRFSRDKTPYKTHMGAKFSATGKKKGIAGYGFGFSADGGLYVMGGVNKLPTPELNLIRDNLVDPKSSLLPLFLDKKFTKDFELSDLGFGQLKNIPRGYPKDFAYPEFLKLQAFWAMHRLDLSDKKKQDEVFLRDYIVEKLALLKPMVITMNQALF